MRSAGRRDCERDLRGPMGLFAAVLVAFLLAVAGPGDLRPSPGSAPIAETGIVPSASAPAGAEATERSVDDAVRADPARETERRWHAGGEAGALPPRDLPRTGHVASRAGPPDAAAPAQRRRSEPRLSTGPPAAAV